MLFEHLGLVTVRLLLFFNYTSMFNRVLLAPGASCSPTCVLVAAGSWWFVLSICAGERVTTGPLWA